MNDKSSSHLSDIIIEATDDATPKPIAPARGLELRWTLYETPFGTALAAFTQFGLCTLEFLDDTQTFPASAPILPALLSKLANRWSDAILVADSGNDRAVIDTAFTTLVSGIPDSANRDIPTLHLRGTLFQIAVWRTLLTIPAGKLVTYGEIAASLGTPKAARAVGSAVGANPIAIFVPCHRVIGASGSLGGYRWGINRKKALIAYESSMSKLRKSIL